MTGSKFEKQLEFHKIPEYSDKYFKYGQLKELIKSYK